MVTVEQLWAEKYAALADAAIAEEAERRAEDFIDVTRTVCGLELRAMTPRDLLHLDYVKNPFVAGGDITGPLIAQFLWQMLGTQPAGWLSKRRFFRHTANLIFDDAVAEIQSYLERTFADQPRGGGGGRPLGTSFVAPLIVRIAAGIPGLSPREIMDTPLPQLFQYKKVLDAESAARSGGKHREYTPTDRMLVECLAEANRLNAAEVAA